MRRSVVMLLSLLFVFTAATPVLAGGFILPDRPEISLMQSYRVDFHDVAIDIADGVAAVQVDQAFTNLTDRPLEVSYLFPVPEGAVVDQFSLVMDGEELQAKLYDRDEARRLYEQIVRQRRDPALLEYAGRGLFRTSVFPIPARGTRRVKLRYRQVVEMRNNLCHLVYPLATERYSARPLERVAVTLMLSSPRTINNVYSPTHALAILARTDHRIVARYAETGVVPRADLSVFYQLSTDRDFEATVLTYRPETGEDGYFLLLASPRAELPKSAVQPKTILFVLDRSGSMSGDKLRQAKEALRTILPNLGREDRFNLIVYNDQVEAFRPAPVAADPAEVGKALALVDALAAIGGTDIEAALGEALRQMAPDEKRGRYVIFLTDGQPTAGEIRPDAIRTRAKAANAEAQARLFVFGVGYDVNTVLLDGLATDNRGLAGYVRPGEDLEAAVANLYRQIQHPVLTDLSLTCDGAALRDCFPRELPDLFHGQQLIVSGRYRGGSGRATLILTGLAGGRKQSYQYTVEFPAAEKRLEHAFIARLWAARKVGYLLDQLRQMGAGTPGGKELIDEVIRLAKAFGIATEYTSFLVLEDAPAASMRLQEAAAAPASGGGAVGNALANKALQAAPSVQNNADQEWTGGRVKNLGDKTFYLRDGVWVDAAYETGEATVKIEAFTEAYFDLAKRLGARALYLSFAERVIVVWEGKAYRIEPGK